MPAALPRRAWQRMLSGRRLDLLAPSPFDIEIEDIALGLSRIVRWNGQTVGEYGLSVAQHSLLVLDIAQAAQAVRANSRLCLAALLHDASEFVTADLITPFKRVIGDAYKEVEKHVQEAVHLRFGLPAALPGDWVKAIKRADRSAAFLEAVEVAGFSDVEARRIFRFRESICKGTLSAWPAERARLEFLSRFETLMSLARGTSRER